MARFDKYDPEDGGFRAQLATAWTPSASAFGVGLDSNGHVVPGAGQTGIVGVIAVSRALPVLNIVDVMRDGEIVEFGGVAGTRYYADDVTGVISTTSPAGTSATLTTGVVGSNNAIKYTAVDTGDAGNGITVSYINA